MIGIIGAGPAGLTAGWSAPRQVDRWGSLPKADQSACYQRQVPMNDCREHMRYDESIR
jgi:hypothetical protein